MRFFFFLLALFAATLCRAQPLNTDFHGFADVKIDYDYGDYVDVFVLNWTGGLIQGGDGYSIDDINVLQGTTVWANCKRLQVQTVFGGPPLRLRLISLDIEQQEPLLPNECRVFVVKETLGAGGTAAAFPYFADGNGSGFLAGLPPGEAGCIITHYQRDNALYQPYTSGELSGIGTSDNPFKLNQQGATTGQVIKWNGVYWSPGTNDDADASTTNEIELPTQTGNSGKYLTTDGTNPSWGTVGGGGATNLSVANKTSTTLDILSDTGTDATVPAATTSEAGLMTASDKTKLDGIATGAEVNVNADWNAGSGDAQILNKPTLYNQTLRDDGTGQTQRGKINFVGTATVTTTLTDDAGSDETEIALSVPTDGIGAAQISTDAVGSSEIATDGVGAAEIAAGAVGASELNQQSATTGQVLKWNGSAWAPGTDNNSGGGGSPNGNAGAVQFKSPTSGNFRGMDIVTIDSATQKFSVIGDASTTNAAVDKIVISQNSTGTPAAGLGGQIKFQGESSTTMNRDMASISGVWTTVTDASRSAAIAFSTVNSAGSLTERLRISPEGYIGIGSTTPVKPLYIVSTAANMGLWVGKNDNLNAWMLGYDNTNNRGTLQSYATGNPSNMQLQPDGGNCGLGLGTTAPGDKLDISGNIRLRTAGNLLKVKEGTNAAMGTATLVGGTVTVNNTLVTASTRIFLTIQTAGGTLGSVYISARTAATSFTITSSSGADTSTVAWFFVEPAP